MNNTSKNSYCELKNIEFLKCFKYINNFSEIDLYKFMEDIVYDFIPENKIKEFYKDLEKKGEKKFVEDIRKTFKSKEQKENNQNISRKNIKDIMIETFAIKTGKSKEDIKKIKMLILLKKITTKNITFKNGEIENIDY